jgi:malonate decarboxylase delta subunit
MEDLQFKFATKPFSLGAAERSVLCGVVSSGNLEVLVESQSDERVVLFEIDTAAEGFSEIWTAVLSDFADQHAVGGLLFSVNDVGATPAIVSLRLKQALELLQAERGEDKA